MVVVSPTILTITAINGVNRTPLLKYKIDNGNIIVRLLRAKNKTKTHAAKIIFSGVYLNIVFTDKGSSDFLTITKRINVIRIIAAKGVSFFSFISDFFSLFCFFSLFLIFIQLFSFIIIITRYFLYLFVYYISIYFIKHILHFKSIFFTYFTQSV